MVLFHTLEDFLEELMLNPNEPVVNVKNNSCAIYLPREDEFLFVDGDFSGSDEDNERELKRILRRMGYHHIR